MAGGNKMTIEKIVNYVLHTPHNTNKAILIAMLKDLIISNGGNIEPDGDDFIYDGGIESEGNSAGGDYIYDGGIET
jgi:spore coat protein CotH